MTKQRKPTAKATDSAAKATHSTAKTASDQAVRDLITGTIAAGLEQTYFVRAGAGAGKTSCLQDRVKNLLMTKVVVPEKLAVITYTNRAANEIKDRIRFSLEAEATKGKNRETAVKILDELNKAKISTVHSFCFDLLKEYPVEFRIDPNSEIADERFTKLIKQEVRALFYEADALKDKRFAKELKIRSELLEEFPDAISEDSLFELFNLFYANRELAPRKLLVGGENDTAKPKAEVRKLLKELCTDILVNIEKAIEDESDALYRLRPEILQTLALYQVKTPKDAVDQLAEALLSGVNNPFKGAGNQKGYRDAKFLKDYKARAKALAGAIAEYEIEKALSCYNLILDIYPAYQKLYDEYKCEHGYLDFADCLILLRNGLRDNVFLAEALQSRFDALIVDEFQDSDPLQAQIMFYLAADDSELDADWTKCQIIPGKLVFVGDPKQSIYGFARADISIYLKVAKLLTAQHKKADQALTTNFRSAPEIVSFVNKIFSKLIKTHETEPFASPEYEPMAAYQESLGSESTKPSVQVLALKAGLPSDKPGEKGVKQDGTPGVEQLRAREAWAVAQMIKSQIDSKAATPGDFLILFRKAVGMGDYEKALEKFGIPVANSKGRLFLQLPEVVGLVSILGLLVNPNEKHYLVAALKSAYLGYSDTEIHTLFGKCGERVSLENCKNHDSRLEKLEQVARGSGSLDYRFEEACECLSIMSNAMALGDTDLVGCVINLTEILRAELKVNDFNEKKTLKNLVSGALKSQSFGMKKSEDDELSEEKLLLQTLEPTKVRLMTVHEAKGLENEFVIIANPSALRIDTVNTIVDRERGEITALKYPLLGHDLRDCSQLVKKVEREEIFKVEEENRVLYVAATRAKKGLFIVRYEGVKAGSFLAPMTELLDDTTPVQVLTVDESYLKRFEHDDPKGASVVKPVSPGDLDSASIKRKDACAKINEKGAQSEAVTSQLKEEAAILFKNNIDGKARGKEFGALCHLIFEWLCQKAAMKVSVVVKDALAHLNALNGLADYQFEAPELASLAKAVEGFMGSELYQQILAADSIFTEVPFQVVGEVHGVIDLIFTDAAGVHVVDWKSDTFSTSQRKNEVSAFYLKQLCAYVTAVENRFGQKVASKRCVYVLGV